MVMGLPDEVVETGSITTFKRDLGRYMEQSGSEGNGPNVGKWDKLGWDIISTRMSCA